MEIAGLSFLGLGAAPPAAEWGAMMSNGRSMLQTAPWIILAPGVAIFVSVLIFNMFGSRSRPDGIRITGEQVMQEDSRSSSNNASNALLNVSHLDISYNDELTLKDISFGVNASEILGIAGESGSGKSTLIKAVMGL